jgi:SAM-dependent MidA family methyltransferase
MSQVSSSPLQQLICERIGREGPLSFAEYMRMALYEPGYGYYVSGLARMGWSGDYFTSSDVSDLFASCLGRQLLACWEALKRPDPFLVLEQGAGRGDLAAGVQTWASSAAPALAKVLDYRPLDIHSGQDSLQPSDLLPQAHMLLSNELIDAFPVDVIEVRAGQLYEVAVDAQQGQLREMLREPASPVLADYLDRYRVKWRTYPDGWRAEINLDAHHWLTRVVPLLRPRGFLLAIDYGAKAQELYTRERRRGTLLCYYRHQANEFPLRLPGQQDITAHVNFSALIERGRTLGLTLSRYTTQRQWLEDCGLTAELEQRRARDFSLADSERASDRGQIALLQWRNLRERASILTDPHGMGNFKVLIMRRKAFASAGVATLP